jgi:hypothetical protein
VKLGFTSNVIVCLRRCVNQRSAQVLAMMAA